MAEILKPVDINKIWSASGDILAPSDTKISQGWAVEIPPRQYFNYIDNKQDQSIAHINQHGIAQWDPVTEYQAGKSYVQGSDGNIYKATTTNTNINPVGGLANNWSEAFITNSSLSARLARVGGVVGDSRNLKASVPSPSAAINITADELLVVAGLGGQPYKITNFNQSLNTGSVGAGGMDTGLAPVSGFVGIYAIYNPTTQASALLGTVGATVLPATYNGSAMPTGYTASALISSWATNASRQFVIGLQVGRRVATNIVPLVSTNTATTTATAFSTLAGCPPNAVEIDVIVNASQTSNGTGVQMVCSATPTGLGATVATATVSGQISTTSSRGVALVLTPGSLYYYMTNTNAGTYLIQSVGYKI